MPLFNGYFSGGPASVADARLVARHLAGVEPLAPELLARADVDGDGRVNGADLLALLRVAAGQATLPIVAPRLLAVEPSTARVGMALTLTCEHLASPGTTVAVVASLASSTVLLQGHVAGPDTVSLVLPNPAPWPAPLVLDLEVLRDGVASNPVPLTIVAGPVLSGVEPAQATAGTVVRLRGAGFGSVAAAVSVRFGTITVAPSNVDDGEVQVAVPAGLSHAVAVRVTADGNESNELAFQPLDLVAGRAMPPAGSPVVPSSCVVRSESGGSATPDADGSFQIEAPLHGALTLVDTSERVLLAAVVTGSADQRLNAASSALWLVFQAAGGALLSAEARTQALFRLGPTPQLIAFATLLEPVLATEPILREAVAKPAVAGAFGAAMQRGLSTVRSLAGAQP